MTTAIVIIVLFAIVLLGAAGYSVVKGFYRVPTDMVGVVEQRFGRGHPIFTEVNPGGRAGFQADLLLPNRIYIRPAILFRVTVHPRTIVPLGTIGLVVAKEGPHIPPHQLLGAHVECNLFQDGRTFLHAGGQQGKQPGLLRAGRYNINPKLFDVLTVDTIGVGQNGLTAADLYEVPVPVGTTGVVIAMAGAPASAGDYEDRPGAVGPRPVGRVVPGHHFFELPWIFLHHGGQLGAQAETLPEGGVYRINPWFARVVFIPTRDLILEFTDQQGKPANNYDAPLKEMRISLEGHWLRFDVTQIIRIPPAAAPYLVGSFGERLARTGGNPHAGDRAPVQQFVAKVLGSTVEGYFHEAASGYEVLDFVASSDEVRKELQQKVAQALAEWGVFAVRTTLREFRPEGTTLDELRQKMADQRYQGSILKDRERNAEIEARIEAIRLQTGITAEQKRRLIDSVVLQAHIDTIGRDAATLEMLLRQLKDMGVPAIIGADAGAILDRMPMAAALDMINRIVPGYGVITGAEQRPAVPATPEPPDQRHPPTQ